MWSPGTGIGDEFYFASFFFLFEQIYATLHLSEDSCYLICVINVRCAQVNGVYPLCGIYSKVLIM